MAITALPALDRTGATFRTDVDTFFDSQLPTFSVEVEAARVAIVASASTASTAASTATTQAGNASTSASTATTQAGIATTRAGIATTKAGEANASASAAAASAAVAASAAAFVDTNPVVKGSADATKQVRFEVDGLTTATTRVLTVPDADMTLVGADTAQTLTNKTLTGYTETVYALSGTVIDPANGTIQTKTLSANTTFTESLADGQSVILGITAGAYSITWPTTVWAKVGGSGVAPTLVSTGVNWITLWQVAGTLYGSFLGTT